MTNLEISNQAAEKLQKLSQQTQKTANEIVDYLIENYGYTLVTNHQPVVEDDVTWTQEELEELLTPKEPLTGKEIAASGLLGGWANQGIEDSLEWVEQQRAKRRNKYKW